MEIEELVEVLWLSKDGRLIEQQSRHRPEAGWIIKNHSDWDTSSFNYRIKPEPREWWINVKENATSYPFQSKETAERVAVFGWKTVHVREVLDEKDSA